MKVEIFPINEILCVSQSLMKNSNKKPVNNSQKKTETEFTYDIKKLLLCTRIQIQAWRCISTAVDNQVI